PEGWRPPADAGRALDRKPGRPVRRSRLREAGHDGGGEGEARRQGGRTEGDACQGAVKKSSHHRDTETQRRRQRAEEEKRQEELPSFFLSSFSLCFLLCVSVSLWFTLPCSSGDRGPRPCVRGPRGRGGPRRSPRRRRGGRGRATTAS